MIAAVTGGRGFIGRKLVEALSARGDRVRVLTRRNVGGDFPGVDYVRGDLTSPDTDLGAFLDGADVLYHCAGEVGDVRLMREVHVRGTERLLLAARGRIGRWVQLSSVGAYGPVKVGKITESCPEAPVGDYETTKTEGDALVRAAGEAGDFAAVVLRPSIVYGPTMTNRSLFQLIGAVERGWFMFIGKPGASANYIHVDDVVRALLLSGDHANAAGRTYVVSDYCTIEQFIGLIAKRLGRRIPGFRLPEPAMRAAVLLGRHVPKFPLTEGRIRALTNFAWYSDECICRELGYIRSVSMESGIAQMVEQWRQQCHLGEP
ncbi:MAG: NAD-dependent epimerase/dehydratase family protein [Gammaproteobacteria bacterium]